MGKILAIMMLLSIALIPALATISNNNGRTKLGLTQIHKDTIRNSWPHWMPKKENQRLKYIHHKMRQANAAAISELDLDITIEIGEGSSAQKVALDPGESIGTANYVVHVELGTPPTKQTWIVDTGSDLAWTQCKPCRSCYHQVDPVFDPATSATYSAIQCTAAACNGLADFAAGCENSTGTCQYVIKYGDGSNTTGDYFVDVLSFGSGGASYPGYPIGCGHTNIGLFNGSGGLIGFSLGDLAFPNQTSTSSFAYCLSSPFSDTSDGYIEIPAAEPAASGSCSPLVRTTRTSFFILTLSSVSVDKTQLGATSAVLMIVDSGTVITRLPSPLYSLLRTAFRNATSMFPTAEGDGFFEACFTVPSNVTSVNVPSVSFNFDGNATFTPTGDGLLIPLGNSVYCLAYVSMPAGADYGILGNFQQQSYELTFDIQSSRICFGSSTSC